MQNLNDRQKEYDELEAGRQRQERIGNILGTVGIVLLFLVMIFAKD